MSRGAQHAENSQVVKEELGLARYRMHTHVVLVYGPDTFVNFNGETTWTSDPEMFSVTNPLRYQIHLHRYLVE